MVGSFTSTGQTKMSEQEDEELETSKSGSPVAACPARNFVVPEDLKAPPKLNLPPSPGADHARDEFRRFSKENPRIGAMLEQQDRKILSGLGFGLDLNEDEDYDGVQSNSPSKWWPWRNRLING